MADTVWLFCARLKRGACVSGQLRIGGMEGGKSGGGQRRERGLRASRDLELNFDRVIVFVVGLMLLLS